jgi:hypothetical protein
VVTNLEVVDTLTNSDNYAGTLVANDCGEIHQRKVVRAVVVVRVAQTGSHELNLNLTTLGAGQLEVFYCPLARKFTENGGANFLVFTHERVPLSDFFNVEVKRSFVLRLCHRGSARHNKTIRTSALTP